MARQGSGGKAAEGRDLTAFWVVGGIVLAIAVVVAVIAIAENRSPGDEQASELGPSFGEVTVTGDSLPQFTGAETDPAVGMTAPVVEGQMMGVDARPMTIGEPGRAQVIVFLAHWCPHCQSEVEDLVARWGDTPPEGAQVLSMATMTREGQPKYPPQQWLEEEGWMAPVLLDDQLNTASSAFGMTGTPFFVMLDEEGTVVHRHGGLIPIEELEAWITGDAAADEAA